MDPVVIVLIAVATVAAVLAIALIVVGTKLSKMKKLHTSEEAEDVYVKKGVRYSKDTTVTKDGETHVSHDKGDFVLVKGVTYLPERGEGLMPGTYTALASAETVSTFKLRLGGYVREYKHGDTVVLAEGDPVCAVSCNVILR